MPTLTLRYEDMRSSPLPALFSLVDFLLPPPAERPSLSTLACALVPDPDRDAYVSQKHSMFSSWDKWDDAARRRVLQITKDGWCRFGYDHDLRRALGSDVETGVDCSSIRGGSLLA